MSVAHQATCVAVASEGRLRGILIEGLPGTGKSSLALALIDRGARLVGDDGVMLSAEDGQLFAAPHPNTRGLIEVRNVGLVPMAAVDRAAVCLLLALEDDAPRFVENAPTIERAGIAIPRVALWPGAPVLALRAEQALAVHGLPLP